MDSDEDEDCTRDTPGPLFESDELLKCLADPLCAHRDQDSKDEHRLLMGSGYRLAEIVGASSPSGWSGCIKVKNPAGVTAGYLLLYSNP